MESYQDVKARRYSNLLPIILHDLDTSVVTVTVGISWKILSFKR